MTENNGHCMECGGIVGHENQTVICKKPECQRQIGTEITIMNEVASNIEGY